MSTGPVLIFDHINGRVGVVSQDPAQVLEAVTQSAAVTTGGSDVPHRP